jgi:hypothetical protein
MQKPHPPRQPLPRNHVQLRLHAVKPNLFGRTITAARMFHQGGPVTRSPSILLLPHLAPKFPDWPPDETKKQTG